MSMNYSNQETSVTVGESIRDEDGTGIFVLFYLSLLKQQRSHRIHAFDHPLSC